MDGVDAPPLFLQHSRRYGQKADLLSICWIMTQNPQIFGKLRAATLTFVEAHICMSTPAPHAHAKVTERGQDSVCLVIIDAPRGTQKVGLSPTPSTMSSTLGGGGAGWGPSYRFTPGTVCNKAKASSIIPPCRGCTF